MNKSMLVAGIIMFVLLTGSQKSFSDNLLTDQDINTQDNQLLSEDYVEETIIEETYEETYEESEPDEEIIEEEVIIEETEETIEEY